MKLMLRVCIGLVAFSAVISQIMTPQVLLVKMQAAVLTCRALTNVQQSDIEQLMKLQIPQSQESACFVACVGKNMGMMTVDNKINVDTIKQMAAPFRSALGDKYSQAERVLDKCAAEVVDGNECNAAKNAMQCAMTFSKEIGLFDTISQLTVAG